MKFRSSFGDEDGRDGAFRGGDVLIFSRFRRFDEIINLFFCRCISPIFLAQFGFDHKDDLALGREDVFRVITPLGYPFEKVFEFFRGAFDA